MGSEAPAADGAGTVLHETLSLHEQPVSRLHGARASQLRLAGESSWCFVVLELLFLCAGGQWPRRHAPCCS